MSLHDLRNQELAKIRRRNFKILGSLGVIGGIFILGSLLMPGGSGSCKEVTARDNQVQVQKCP